jgi:hypothetical protein
MKAANNLITVCTGSPLGRYGSARILNNLTFQVYLETAVNTPETLAVSGC